MAAAASYTQRARSALRALFVADALSMPVHWYYSTADIKRTFGVVDKFYDAPDQHPSSIMNLHSTSTGGRTGASKQSQQPVVGRLILKEKAHLWTQRNTHYHHGMKAGENTLNAHCARVLLRSLADHHGYSADSFLQEYVAFMTHDPPLHPDSYAESYHRSFFANYDQGKPVRECGAVSHDTPSVGGLVTAAPLAVCLLLAGHDVGSTRETLRTHVSLTHPDESLLKVSDNMVELIHDLLFRSNDSDPGDIIAAAGKRVGVDVVKLLAHARKDSDVVGGTYTTACYISGSWPNILYLAYKYHSQPMDALVANTNLGGENCHRGSVLGVIVGLASGEDRLPLYRDLANREQLDGEINAALAFSSAQ